MQHSPPLAQADEIEAMLPWFVTDRLTSSEQTHLAACFEAYPSAASHVALAREERIISIIVNEAIAGPSSSALDRLMTAVAATPQPRRWIVPSVASIWHQAAAFFAGFSPRTLGIAAATAAFILAAQAITISTLLPRNEDKFSTAFGDSPVRNVSGGFELLVALQPSVTAAALTSALAEFNAVVIDGPKGGLYRLRVGSGKIAHDVAAQTTANLKARQDVFAFVGRVAAKP